MLNGVHTLELLIVCSSLLFQHLRGDRSRPVTSMATKLGFTLAASARPRAAAPLSAAVASTPLDFVTAIGDGQLASTQPAPVARVLVIPALANTFETGRGKRPRGAPSFLPEREAEQPGDRFEAAVENETAQAAGVAFGLNTRARPAAAEAQAAPAERSFVERALAGRAASREALEAEALRDDLLSLPDSAGAAAYEAMPVESFGEAMLRGMGWREGAPVGRSPKPGEKPVLPVEYIPRPQLLGLGATAAPAASLKPDGRPQRPGESRQPCKHLVLPVGPDGRVRNVRTLDETLVARPLAGCVPGKVMTVVARDSPHCGLRGEVLSLDPPKEGRSQRALLRLSAGGESVRVRCKELVDAGSADADAAEARRRMPPPAAPCPAAAREPVSAPWLAPHIRVRIISQSLQGGALYLKKAVILDVTSPTSCTLQLDGGAVVDGVPQRSLETLLPRKAPARLLVVLGRDRGARAKLVARDAAAGTAHVRLCGDLQVVTLPLDAVAEYAGPLDEQD